MRPYDAFSGKLAAEDGGVIVLFGLLVPIFLLLGAMSIDVGNWYLHKRHLQTQVDAAALAGGGVFGECFKPAAADPNGAIFDEATRYNGDDGAVSIYNNQVGGSRKGTVSVWYQNTTFPAGGTTDPDSYIAAPPCDNFVLDVKGSEQNLPYIFFGAAKLVPRLNAHARVQLNKVSIAKGSMPLAVPDINPRYATATFVNESGAVVAGPVSLSGPTPSGELNAWTGTANVNVPANGRIGVRIGLGQVAGTCDAANRTGGTGYVCYDYSQFSTGLVNVAGFSSGGTPLAPDRRAFEVWPFTACSGSPFFSDESLDPNAPTCPAGVQATLNFGSGVVDPTKVRTFTATVTGAGFNRTASFTFSGGVWSTGYAFDVPRDNGPYDIAISWQYTGGTRATYTIHQFHSGGDDSGPVKVVRLGATGGVGAPYALPAGSHTLTVNVAVAGTLKLSTNAVLLRLTGGSRTSAVACDGPGADLFREAIVNGCKTPYQMNSAGYCPDPVPPPGPATCIPTQTGDMAGPTLQGLDTRFASCPPYLYPDYEDDDPRIVKLLVTDFSALGGSGTTEVPVMNIATFYIAGWTGSRCSNPPPPVAIRSSTRALWGHFIKYAGSDPTSVGTEKCVADAITPCVAVMTR